MAGDLTAQKLLRETDLRLPTSELPQNHTAFSDTTDSGAV